jgi:hypothetical protein
VAKTMWRGRVAAVPRAYKDALERLVGVRDVQRCGPLGTEHPGRDDGPPAAQRLKTGVKTGTVTRDLAEVAREPRGMRALCVSDSPAPERA